MKKITFLMALLLLNCPCFAQFEFGMNYSYAEPYGEMAAYIRQIHGLNFQGLYQLPKNPIYLGIELGFAGYGHQKERQTYTFSDGSQIETDVHVSNNILNINLVARVDLLENTTITPYALFKTGLSNYFTQLYIADPDDPTDCQALEQENLISDLGFTGTFGAGIKWNLKNKRLFLDLSANYMLGSRVSYMSVKTPQPNQSPRYDVNAQFINVRTQIVHEHHVGYVYESAIQMVAYRLGLVFKLQ